MSAVRDLEAVYDAEISPLMAEIIAICKRVGMPFIASFEYAPEALCTSSRLDNGSAPELHRALAVVRPEMYPSNALHLTVRDAAGNVTRMETIL
jgi:hypothetical protein